MHRGFRLIFCLFLAGCSSAPYSPYSGSKPFSAFKKPTARGIRAQGVPELEIPRRLQSALRGWAYAMLSPNSGATSGQIKEANKILKEIEVTMFVLPTHDLDSMPPVSDPSDEMFDKNCVTFDSELVSLEADSSGKQVATFRLKYMCHDVHYNEDHRIRAKPSLELIRIASRKWTQIPVQNQKLLVTINPEGRVVTVNMPAPDDLMQVKGIHKLPDGRYRVDVSNPESDGEVSRQKASSLIVDHLIDCLSKKGETRFEGFIDYYSLSASGWTIWNFEKGPGSSNLAWLKPPRKRGSFD